MYAIYTNKDKRICSRFLNDKAAYDSWCAKVAKAGLICCNATMHDDKELVVADFTSKPDTHLLDNIRIHAISELKATTVTFITKEEDMMNYDLELDNMIPTVPANCTFKFKYNGQVSCKTDLTLEAAMKLFEYSKAKNVDCYVLDGKSLHCRYDAVTEHAPSAVTEPSPSAKVEAAPVAAQSNYYLYFHKKGEPWQFKGYSKRDEAAKAMTRGMKAGFECAITTTRIFG